MRRCAVMRIGLVIALSLSTLVFLVRPATAQFGGFGTTPSKSGSNPAKTGPVRPGNSGASGTAPSSAGSSSSGLNAPSSSKSGSPIGPVSNGAAGTGTTGARPVGTGATPAAAGKSSGAPLPAGLQQPVARQPANQVVTPQTPSWIPLPAEHEKYLDQVLNYWQHKSSDVKRYRARFTRWEYDGVFVARDPKTGELPAKTQSTGSIKYASPDKGMFKVERTLYFTPGRTANEKAQYLPHEDDKGEEWICDGKSVFAMDHQKKQLIQTELPPDMQGRAIVDGPLPFMFGADAAKIKQRFWMRVITPKDTKGEYWLEAVPKTRTDAANFKMIHIIIDEADYLPKAMAIFDRNYDGVRNPTCTNFVFEKREVNWNDTLDKLNIFMGEFWEPKTPLGYKKVVERYRPPTDERVPAPVAGPPASPSVPTKQATRPAAPRK